VTFKQLLAYAFGLTPDPPKGFEWFDAVQLLAAMSAAWISYHKAQWLLYGFFCWQIGSRGERMLNRHVYENE
jgi:hypothetical protein